MDSSMEINKIPALYDHHNNNIFICLLHRLDTKFKKIIVLMIKLHLMSYMNL